MRKYFVGLDMRCSHPNVCILDARGKKVKALTVRDSWLGLIEQLRKLRGRLFVCYEASCGYGRVCGEPMVFCDNSALSSGFFRP